MGLFSKKERDDFTIKNGVCTVTFVGKRKLAKNRVDTFYSKNKEIHDCDAIHVMIGEGTTVIEANAFNWAHLVSVTIPSTVTTIGACAFTDCNMISSINVDEGNQSYKSIDGDLYTKDGKTMLSYARGKLDTAFTIPDGVTTIGIHAFHGAEKLESIKIPASVTAIGDSAFVFAKSLKSIEIPASVTTIGDNAFVHCDVLTTVTLADGITSIGKKAFCCCKLASITIPGSVVSIGEEAFMHCNSLKIVKILNGVKSIGGGAFSYIGYDSTITIPSSVVTIGWKAFGGRGTTILCQIGKQPKKGWHAEWKDWHCTVKWGWDTSGKQLND